MAIQQIPFDGELKFASFDITNIYTNVPHKKVREMIRDILSKNDVEQMINKEILNIYDVIMQQNYFYFRKNTIYNRMG
jgi:hypothetical protein